MSSRNIFTDGGSTKKVFDTRKESRPPSSTPKLRRKKQLVSNTEIEAKFQELTEQLEEEKLRNRGLYISCMKMQDRFVKREKEFKRTLADYEKILFPSHSPSNDLPLKSREKIMKRHQKMQDRIEMVQTQTINFLQDHERLIVRDMNQELNDFQRKYLESQKKNSIKAITIDKKVLHDEIVKNRAKVEVVETQNNYLHKSNTELKIQFKTHENDGKILNEHIQKLKLMNGKLRNELVVLREKNGSKSRTGFESGEKKKSSERAQTDRPKAQRMETGYIEDLKKMIELEKKNLRAARNAYTRELQDRIELENVLKLEIDQDLLSPRPISKGKKGNDRKELLKTLYFKTFPLKTKPKPPLEPELDSEALIEHLDKNIQYIEKLYSQHEYSNLNTDRFLSSFT